MGFLSSVGGLTSFSTPTSLSSIGSAFNDLTGITSSANQAFQQNLALAHLSNAYSKEFAKNAHQWEMNDLQKAGLNPALTATGTSAGAIASSGGNGNSGSVGTSAMSPIDIVSALNQTSATKHSNQLQDAQGEFAKAQALATIEILPINKEEKQALIKKLNAETTNTYNNHWILNRLPSFGNKGKEKEKKVKYKEPTPEERKKGILF